MEVSEVEEIIDNQSDNFEIEANARDIYQEQYDRAVSDGKILVRDTYCMVDGQRKRYVLIGNEIIYRDDMCDVVPFACITPMIMPHRHIGRSHTDLTNNIQLIKST